MQHKKSGIVIVGILLFTHCFASAGVTSNIFVNGGFEDPGVNEKQVAEGWWSKNVVRSGEQKHGGAVSLSLPVLTNVSKKMVSAQRHLDVSLFKAGDTVEFSLYAMSTAKLGPDSHPYARLIFSDSNWVMQAEAKVKLPSKPTSMWRFMSDSVTIPDEFNADSHVDIDVVIWVGDKPEKAGAIYVDDIQVTSRPARRK